MIKLESKIPKLGEMSLLDPFIEPSIIIKESRCSSREGNKENDDVFTFFWKDPNEDLRETVVFSVNETA